MTDDSNTSNSDTDLSELNLNQRLEQYNQYINENIPPIVEGRLTRMVGLTLEAVGCNAQVGDLCKVYIQGNKTVDAEVVGFSDERIYLMPIEQVEGVRPGARVVPIPRATRIEVGWNLLGRVIDANGQPLDDKGPLNGDHYTSLVSDVINPLQRAPIREHLDVGVRAINAMLAVGRGQRLGLFAGSGVGKSMLLGMMTRFTDADITIVGLIGERGREVKEFIEDILGEEGLARSVVVASPADDSPLLRLRAANYCTAIAEFFRDQGKNVLLLMDSLTRYAQAQREIALAIGEPPATKGYPPSSFAKIPKLVERAGNGPEGGGSITAFYTVLTEGDDMQDPIADAARAILDGHIALSRRLAEEGHYPAIDIEGSISRAMPQVVNDVHLKSSQNLKQLYSYYQQNKDLVTIGAYAPGSDPELDKAIKMMPAIKLFLQQGLQEKVSFTESVQLLSQLIQPSVPSPTGQTNQFSQPPPKQVSNSINSGQGSEPNLNQTGKGDRLQSPLARQHQSN